MSTQHLSLTLADIRQTTSPVHLAEVVLDWLESLGIDACIILPQSVLTNTYDGTRRFDLWLQPDAIWLGEQLHFRAEGQLLVPLVYAGVTRGLLACAYDATQEAAILMMGEIMMQQLGRLYALQQFSHTRTLTHTMHTAANAPTLRRLLVEGGATILDAQGVLWLQYDAERDALVRHADYPHNAFSFVSLASLDYAAIAQTLDAPLLVHAEAADEHHPMTSLWYALHLSGFPVLLVIPIHEDGHLTGLLQYCYQERAGFWDVPPDTLEHAAALVAAYTMARQYHELRDAQQDHTLFLQVIEQTQVPVDISDYAGQVIYRNPAWEVLFAPSSDFIHFQDRLLPDDHELLETAIQPQAATVNGWSQALVHQRGDGSTFLAEATVQALRDETDQVIAYSTITKPIADEDALRQPTEAAGVGVSSASLLVMPYDDAAPPSPPTLYHLLHQTAATLCVDFGYARVQVLWLNAQDAHWRRLMDYEAGTGVVGRLNQVVPLEEMPSWLATLREGQASLLPAQAQAAARLIVPLHGDGAPIGVMAVEGRGQAAFSDEAQRMLQLIADHLAAAIQHHHSLHHLQHHMQAMTAITEMSALAQVARDLGDLAAHVDQMVGHILPDAMVILTFMPLDWASTTEHLVFVDGQPAGDTPLPAAMSAVLDHIAAKRTLLLWNDAAERREQLAGLPLEAETLPPALLGLPLVANDLLLGTIALGMPHAAAFDEYDMQFVMTLGSSIAVTISNTQLLQATQQRIAEMTTLNNISHILASQFGSNAMWDMLMDELTSLFPHIVPTIALYDRAARAVSVPHTPYSDFDSALPQALQALNLAVIDHGIMLQFDDLLNDAGRLQALGLEVARYAETSAQMWMGIPLRSRTQETIGVLSLQSDAPYPVSDHETSVLMTLAAQISLALDNARLLEAEQERRKIANSLTEMGRIVTSTLDINDVFARILDQVARVVRYDRALILLPTENDGASFSVQVGRGWHDAHERRGEAVFLDANSPLARVYTSRQPFVLQEVATDAFWHFQPAILRDDSPTTWLGVPMVMQTSVIGLLSFDRQQAPAFTDDEAGMVFALARQAAVAVENARLHTEARTYLDTLEERARRLASMQRIASIVNSTLSQESVLNTAAELLVGLFQVDHAQIVLVNAQDDRGFLVAEYPATSRPDDDTTSLDAPAHEALRRILRHHEPLQITTEDAVAVLGVDALSDLSTTRSRTALLAPMIAHDRVLGGIILTSHKPDAQFSPGVRSTFMTIASQIAMAVRNAELYEAALESNRLKSEFLASISHELRTPLNAVIGYSELLLNGTYGELPEIQANRLERVYNGGQSLLVLINDILDLSKLEAGRMALDRMPLDLRVILADAAANIEPKAADKGLVFHQRISDTLPKVAGDLQRIRQILSNLLSNAVKFTHKGAITLEATPLNLDESDRSLPAIIDAVGGQWAHVRVIDTGIGISEADQRIIFQVFRQADGSSVREYEGTGLGLAITRHLVEMHNGYIWVESEVGKGSTFHVLLPAAEPLALADVADYPVVIALDDDQRALHHLEKHLKQAPYHLITTVDPDEIEQLVQEVRPDLLIVNTMMLFVDGYAVVKRLQTDARTHHVPIVVVTNNRRQRASDLGVAALLHHPIQQQILFDTLRAVLDQAD